MPLPKLVRTASFRLSALYAIVFGACVLLLGAAAFWSTRSFLERQLTRRTEAETMLLEQEFRSNGIDRLVATVRQREQVKGNLDYFLVNSSGKRLAGDLPIISGRVGWVEYAGGADAGAQQGGEDEPARVLVTQLDGENPVGRGRGPRAGR